jgi:hypothetical protein
MTRGQTVAGGDRIGKTIIFAKFDLFAQASVCGHFAHMG